MWQIFIICRAIKCKLQNLHPRPACLLYQLPYIRSNHTQILGNNIGSFCCLFDHIRKLFARSFSPFAIYRCRAGCRNGPEIYNPDKMVNTDHIIQLCICFHALIPPAEMIFFHCFPVVKRITPALSVCRKTIWRYSRNIDGFLSLIQFKKIRMCPYIGTVHRNVQRNISDQTNLFLVGILFKSVPLLIKLILTKLPESDFVCQLFLPFFHCILLTESNILLPKLPFLIVIFKL